VSDGTFEIVDGAQRIQTLVAFMDNDLELLGLKRLTTLNGFKYEMLPETQRNKFASRALRLVILDQSTSDDNRKELFDRINKSGKKLMPSERRRGALGGRFIIFLQKLREETKIHYALPSFRCNEETQRAPGAGNPVLRLLRAIPEVYP